MPRLAMVRQPPERIGCKHRIRGCVEARAERMQRLRGWLAFKQCVLAIPDPTDRPSVWPAATVRIHADSIERKEENTEIVATNWMGSEGDVISKGWRGDNYADELEAEPGRGAKNLLRPGCVGNLSWSLRNDCVIVMLKAAAPLDIGARISLGSQTTHGPIESVYSHHLVGSGRDTSTGETHIAYAPPIHLTEIRVTNIIECLTPALTLLKELNDAFGPPFIQSIANTIESLISMTHTVKRNKNECALLMENIHPVLYAIISLYLKSEPVESLAPGVLHNIGRFMGTLHKIYTFLRAQQDGNKLKHLFRHNEMQNLLQGCRAGLDQAAEVFNITTRPAMISEINAIRKTTQLMHEELLELIQTQCDFNFISMLPSKPKIFHGRELEVENIMKMLTQESPRIAILEEVEWGRQVLQEESYTIQTLLQNLKTDFFIELAALIGLHVGLSPGTNLTRPVVQYLSCKSSCLLVLDNLETVWEPIQSRGGIEEFLALLTAVKRLALIITMRGAERPAKVHWTHPFLSPLQPLSAEAAQQTFMEITDNVYRKEEGLSNVLARWDTERTAVLSVGYDRKSNVDASIQLSLSSPRITSNSKELLSLLSILPDGLSDAELVQSKLPIPNVLSCKSVLLATSLAYQDSNWRLRSLMPVREHVQQFLPPSTVLVQCLRKLYYALLELYMKITGRDGLALMEHIQSIVPGLDDYHLKIQFMTQVLLSYDYYPTFDREQIITEAIRTLELVNNPVVESKFYMAAGIYFQVSKFYAPQAMQFYQRALKLAKMCPGNSLKCDVLLNIAWLEWGTGDYCNAQAHASEAQRLSQLSANLYDEAKVLWVEAMCLRSLGNFKQSVDQLHRSRVMLGICGLADGSLDRQIAIAQGEFYLQKSGIC
ncbi:hypothetical protein B0H14DRAFT_3154939 [Mycena olivaceomarginata]|nr:hypothetical protein B0H14DRAFT_3154939 [Mycena olivaceomarginata]